jgi:hypothetical protein
MNPGVEVRVECLESGAEVRKVREDDVADQKG